jgi:2'-5' RNA ligase
VKRIDTVRAFIAIELPTEVQKGLEVIQNSLRPGGGDFVRWVSPRSIHLTLKFLGSIPADSVAGIVSGLEKASQGVGPIPLETGGLGAFPNLRRPRVVWVEVKGDVDSLVLLQLQVDEAMAGLGFTLESRPFTPHLTLARLKDSASPEERQGFGEEIGRHNRVVSLAFTAAGLTLMQSTLTPGGAIYRRLSFVPLRG